MRGRGGAGLIRIKLTTDDYARLQVAEAPDFGYELTLGGIQLADLRGNQKPYGWLLEVVRGWNPDHNRLFDLYTRVYVPAFFDQIARPSPSSGIDLDYPPMTAHLRDLARSGALTPFTRALADGRAGALSTLNHVLTALRARALDPYRRRITSLVATASTKATVRTAIAGADDMLNRLHPSVRWDGRELRLNTRLDALELLEGRLLIFQPAALATRIVFDSTADSVTVIYPASAGPITHDPVLHAPAQALISLLGATRAAALVAVVRTPALTTGRLAATLGVSASAASRHASALRESGLLATVRNGETVHHAPTRLGKDLVYASTTKD